MFQKYRSLALLLPLALLACGRLWPLPSAWGFNHLAFLTPWEFWAWLGLVLVFAVWYLFRFQPGRQPALPLTRTRAAILVAAYLAAMLIFRVKTFLLGDGMLIADLIRNGQEIRAFDNLDYVLHFQIYAYVSRFTSLDPSLVYQCTSWLVGLLCLIFLPKALDRLASPPHHKHLFLGLFFTSGSALLFFGYAESYAILFFLLTMFMILGLGTLAGRVSLWVPSLFLGLALAFHMTALFCLPAFVLLVAKAPGTTKMRKMAASTLPVLGGMLVAGFLFMRAQPALQGGGGQGLGGILSESLLGPAGPHGALSLHNLWQQGNLLILVFPVALVLLALRLPDLKSELRSSAVLFLATQVLVVSTLGVLLDKKLGTGRDWDLLLAHSAGFLLLVTFPLLGPRLDKSDWMEQHLLPVLLISVLCFLPWVAVNARTDSSLKRFATIAPSFPPYAQAYAFESLAQYYRDNGDIETAVTHYRKCVESRPGNARFHKILGSSYLEMAGREGISSGQHEAYRDSAAASYGRALELDPDLYTVRDNLSRILLQQKQFPEAIGHLEILTRERPENAVAWSSLGYAYLNLRRFSEAAAAFRTAMAQDPDIPIKRYLALAMLETGDFKNGQVVLQQAMVREKIPPSILRRFSEEAVEIAGTQGHPDAAQAQALLKVLRIPVNEWD
jgi:Flp pilus assembly protein TadD